MINLPIAELLTPTGIATATTVPEGQTDTLVTASFLKTLAEISMPNGVNGLQTGVDDPEQLFATGFPTQVLVVPQAGFDILEGSQGNLPDPVGDSEMDIGGVLATGLTPTESPDLKAKFVAGVSGSQAEIRVSSDTIPPAVPIGTKEGGNAGSLMPANTAPKPENITDTNNAPQKMAADLVQKKTLNSVDNETQPPGNSKADVMVAASRVLQNPSLPAPENQTAPSDAKQHDRKGHSAVFDLNNTHETMTSALGEPKPRGPDAVLTPKQTATRLDTPDMPRLPNKTVLQPEIKQSNAVLPDKPTIPPQGVPTPEAAPKPRQQSAAQGSLQAASAIPDQPEITPPRKISPDRPLPAKSTVPPPSATLVTSTNQLAMAAVQTSVPFGKSYGNEQQLPQHRDVPLAPLPDTPATANNPTAQPAPATPFEVKNAVMTKDAAINSDVSEPLEPFDLHPIEARHIESTSLRNDPAITRPEIPRHVARQLAEVARQMPDRPVELTLNPDELGRVRLTFTLTDGGINVAVLAERGETMDLLRRHIETLAQEFRDMGYSDVGFQFSQNGQANTDGGDGAADHRQTVNAPMPEPDPTPPAKLSLEPSTGLDLRL